MPSPVRGFEAKSFSCKILASDRSPDSLTEKSVARLAVTHVLSLAITTKRSCFTKHVIKGFYNHTLHVFEAMTVRL